MKSLASRWTILITINVTALCLMGAYQWCEAQSKGGQLPFANSNLQRSDILREISEIKELLKEQNALLREGASKNVAPKR